MAKKGNECYFPLPFPVRETIFEMPRRMVFNERTPGCSLRTINQCGRMHFDTVRARAVSQKIHWNCSACVCVAVRRAGGEVVHDIDVEMLSNAMICQRLAFFTLVWFATTYWAPFYPNHHHHYHPSAMYSHSHTHTTHATVRFCTAPENEPLKYVLIIIISWLDCLQYAIIIRATMQQHILSINHRLWMQKQLTRGIAWLYQHNVWSTTSTSIVLLADRFISSLASVMNVMDAFGGII